MIYVCKPARLKIYVNTSRKTTAQIKAETGCTALINGGLFDMSKFMPVCHLKVDGQLLAKDPYGYYGFAWNSAEDLTLTVNYAKYANYICCVSMVRNGQAEKMIYPNDMGGYRPRTAFGVFEDGRVWLYADTANKLTPEGLQKVALKAGVKDAIMLDGGNSTQGATPTDTINGARIVHNYICVWDEAEKTPIETPIETPTETPKTEASEVFKIALSAGHGINTPGKRCLKSLDPNETREWWLNNRICDYVESYLKDYEGYSLLRMDDTNDGSDDVELATRVNMANKWGADFYLSVHHNAGVNGGKGGGIVAFSYYNASKTAVAWRDELYEALIDKTGLAGNRATPKTTAGFYVLKYTKAPAVLLELGFMDSATDVPIILSDEFAQNCARAIVETIVKRAGLKKKAQTVKATYKVQIGAFSSKENAEKLLAELKAKGYQGYIVGG